MQITTGIDIGDRVYIDGDESMKAVVTAIMIRPVAVKYEISWICDGSLHEEWIDEFRLTLVDAPEKQAEEPQQDYPRMGRDG